MNIAQEWQLLITQLESESYSSCDFENQYFRRLIELHCDGNSGLVDILLGYRDALLAGSDSLRTKLPFLYSQEVNTDEFARVGLELDRAFLISLAKKNMLEKLDLDPVYGLVPRRFLHLRKLDPALKAKLNNPAFSHYNGAAQQLAVRLALLDKHKSTMIVNLPTGCGKTLIAHAVSLYAAQSEFTLVIVPTTALAIEQGGRASELFEKAGECHGGNYHWYGQQTNEEHRDIKERISRRTQKILFCSPEAACKSLLPVLFNLAKEGFLANIVIDEAHIVDQWGAHFRPYFQILSSLIFSLRKVTPLRIRCILLSATFTEKTVDLLSRLYSEEKQECIYIGGNFLRPEIQYSVFKTAFSEHERIVIEAVIALPKPMIIYTVTKADASRLYSSIRNEGIRRVSLFTGDTADADKTRILDKWKDRAVDIVVATSAFGLGMDKADVRSVIHAAIPENLDRFYQEVGRGGRDGLACQSLLVYHEDQFTMAGRINTLKLILPALGWSKWKTMWDRGVVFPNGSKRLNVGTIRVDQDSPTDGNEDWNWRTLLLMQRDKMIKILLEEPSPPAQNSRDFNHIDYKNELDSFYNNYYKSVIVLPQLDEINQQSTWEDLIEKRRNIEKDERDKGFLSLKNWVINSDEIPLCKSLIEHYTILNNEPEYACGGCPHCSAHRRVHTPTLGKLAYYHGYKPEKSWIPPLHSNRMRQYVYYESGPIRANRQIRIWAPWLSRLLESGAIQGFCAEDKVLDRLAKELRNSVSSFWIGESFADSKTSLALWPQLVLVTNSSKLIPKLPWNEAPMVLLAPSKIADPANLKRKWWESVRGSISLDNFLSGFRYGDN